MLVVVVEVVGQELVVQGAVGMGVLVAVGMDN
jgi:hypothetical protein